MDASEITSIGTYKPLMDGFYQWWCGKCGEGGGSRAFWNLHGTVEYCAKCGASNLLVRTDCKIMDKGLEVLFELEQKSHGWMVLERGEQTWLYLQ